MLNLRGAIILAGLSAFVLGVSHMSLAEPTAKRGSSLPPVLRIHNDDKAWKFSCELRDGDKDGKWDSANIMIDTLHITRNSEILEIKSSHHNSNPKTGDYFEITDTDRVSGRYRATVIIGKAGRESSFKETPKPKPQYQVITEFTIGEDGRLVDDRMAHPPLGPK